tara:strand:+ start:561 stop:1358 length:798 start_codon:yes stop_codon:yes gene_type:complete
MLIDSHAHLDLLSKSVDFKTIIVNAIKQNITSILSINTEINKFDELDSMIKNYKSIWLSIGEHPCNINKNNIPNTNNIISKINKKVIAIGETGIDLYHNKDNFKSQVLSLENHIEASIISKLPIIIHQRESEKELIDLLSNINKKNKIDVIMHCFTGSTDFLYKCLDNEFYISISGIVTFKKAYLIQKLLKEIPIKRLLIETDSPYLSPVPYRGKLNEPANLIYTAKYISSYINMDFNDFIDKINKNFYRLFTKAIKYERIEYES